MNNLMKFKEVLKPNYKKIIIFIIIQVVLFIYVTSGAPRSLYGASSNPIIEVFQIIAIFLLFPSTTFVLFFMALYEYINDPSIASYGYNVYTISFLLIISLIFMFIWYIIICFLFLGFDKLYVKIRCKKQM